MYNAQSLEKDSINPIVEKQIQSVELKANKKLLERKIDRLIFNVENSISSQGVDAIEVLANTPLIKVDENKGISIIGKSKISVMVNDKIVNLSGIELINYLKSLRSDDISKIEIITTPPAKYEAQGNNGLINILLKKNPNNGFNGNFTSSLTQRSWFNSSNSFALNFQNNKLSSSLKFRHNDNMFHVDETNKFISFNTVESNSKRTDFSNDIGINMSIDYKLKKSSNIGIIYDLNIGKSNMDINNISIYKVDDIITNDLEIYTENRGNRKTQMLNAYYETLLNDNDVRMSITGNYYSFLPETIVNFYTFDKFNETHSYVKNTSITDYSIYSGQIDFTIPYKFANIEFGSKLTNFNNNSNVIYLDLINNNYIIDFSKSNVFDYNEKNYAAYLSGEKKFGEKLSAKLGFRYEYSLIDTYSVSTKRQNNYNYDKIFPSAYIAYKPNKNNMFSINYSKRISRPNIRALNPFRWYTGPYKYFTGNPLLQPSYNHNFEINYIWKSKISFTLIYQKILNNYDQISSLEDEILVSTYKNFFNTKYYGLDINYNDNISKWWKTTINLSTSYSKSDIFNINALAQDGSSLYYSFQNLFNLNKDKTTNLIVNYWQSIPSKSGNSYDRGQGNLSIGLRLMLLEKSLNISITASDILKQQKNIGEMYYTNNTQYFNNYYDFRNFRISLSYKFGNKKIKGVQKNIKFNEISRTN